MTPTELIDQIKRLVAIPSTADNPAALHAAVDFIAAMAAQVPGVTVERFESGGKPSMLAYYGAQRPAKFDILLNAHVDVVPGNEGQFQPYEKDGKLYGRGVLDMKGTAVVLADVFCEVAGKVPYTLGLQIVADEEIGGFDGVKYQIAQGVATDFAIMGEYANEPGTIYNAARGVCWAEFDFDGVAAHGGHPWKGTNAVLKAADFARTLLAHYPTPAKETWTTTANIAHISTTNETLNKVPDDAVLKVDFRFTKEDPVFMGEDTFRAFVAGLSPQPVEVRVRSLEPAVFADTQNPYIQGLSAALRHVTGLEPRYRGRPASSDGRHFAHAPHTAIIEFGIQGQNSHSDGEYAEIASIGEYQAVMRAFLRQPMAT